MYVKQLWERLENLCNIWQIGDIKENLTFQVEWKRNKIVNKNAKA